MLVGRALEKAVAVAREGRRADPPLSVPTGIQPFIDFRRLTGPARAAVARVLDRDDEFRARVADGDGDLDAAATLFLNRPQGWLDELAAMADRRDADLGAQDEQRREQALRRELDHSEARLAELDEITRRSAAEIRSLTEQLAEARRGRRAVTEDLDAAVARLADRDRAAADAARRAEEAEAAAAVRERELGDARRRLDDLAAELERRPPAPADAPTTVDAAELDRTLRAVHRSLDELGAAVGATAALLPDAPPGASRDGDRTNDPAPGRRRPHALPGGLHDDSVEAARHLVAVADMTLLVDGYNVSMLAWPDAELPDQRDWLATRLEALAARVGVEPVVVFDGAHGHSPRPGRPRQQVRVRFSAADVEADDEILDLVTAHPAHRPVTVASNDRRVLDGARSRGANVITSTQLVALL